MDKATLKQNLAQWQDETKDMDLATFLRWADSTFGSKLAFATSLGAEDQVLLHSLAQAKDVCIFTLDTGRLFQETYDVLQASRDKYRRTIEVVFPDAVAVQNLVNVKGPNSFYESVENRKECCAIRKVEPLKKKLSNFDAWMTGMRRSQSVTRTNIARLEWDESYQMIKLNPLVDWSHEQVWEFIHANEVPYNALHDQGFPSIGCAPCSRAIEKGEDERAGRWWWEMPEHKECGLHIKPAKKTFSIKTM